MNRGRQRERDQDELDLNIAGLVAEARPHQETLKAAELAVAVQLGTSASRVHRAWLNQRRAGNGAARLALELELHLSPAARATRVRKVRKRLAEIRRNRGK